MNKNISFAFKVSLAAILAIILANALSLDFFISAGIVAILSVAATKKETVKTAVNRLLGFIIALIVSFLCFHFAGFTVFAFCLYLVVFILICQIFHWNSAMAMDSVLISHFLSFGCFNYKTIMNESMLFVIGVGIGILVNLSLHKNASYMEKMKSETDEQIKLVLSRMSDRIMNSELPNYDGKCFFKLRDLISEALSIANENYMNQFRNGDVADIEYITMRSEQVDVLHEMYKKVSTLKTTPITAKIISDYLNRISESYDEDNTAEDLLNEFAVLHDSMKKQKLPENRQEFEERAQLYGLMKNIEEFLLLKRQYMERK